MKSFYQKVSGWLKPLGYEDIYKDVSGVKSEFHFINGGIRIKCIKTRTEEHCQFVYDEFTEYGVCNLISSKFIVETNNFENLLSNFKKLAVRLKFQHVMDMDYEKGKKLLDNMSTMAFEQAEMRMADAIRGRTEVEAKCIRLSMENVGLTGQLKMQEELHKEYVVLKEYRFLRWVFCKLLNHLNKKKC